MFSRTSFITFSEAVSILWCWWYDDWSLRYNELIVNKIEPSSLLWILYSRWQPHSKGSLKAEQDANFACFKMHTLFAIFPEECWVLKWIWTPVGYMSTGKFDLNTDTCGCENSWIQKKRCGFKNIWIRVDRTSDSKITSSNCNNSPFNRYQSKENMYVPNTRTQGCG